MVRQASRTQTTKDSRESEIYRARAETRRKATARIIPREKIPNARGRRRAGAWSSRAGRDVQVGTPEKCAGEPLRGKRGLQRPRPVPDLDRLDGIRRREAEDLRVEVQLEARDIHFSTGDIADSRLDGCKSSRARTRNDGHPCKRRQEPASIRW